MQITVKPLRHNRFHAFVVSTKYLENAENDKTINDCFVAIGKRRMELEKIVLSF